MDDEAVLDTNIRLRCKSSQGTPPLRYRWAKFSVNRMLDPDAFVDAPEGDLYLDKITERDSGTYRCTVQNLVGMEDCELILKITSPPTVIDGHGLIAGTTAGITAEVGLEECEPVLSITSPSTVIDGRGPNTGTTAEIKEEVGMEDCEPVLSITSPSTVIDCRGPNTGTPAEIKAGVGMEDCELVLKGIIAGAIVAVIVVITVMLTPVIYYCRRRRCITLRRNACIWAQRNSCNYVPPSLEQVMKVQLKKSAHVRGCGHLCQQIEYCFILRSSLQLRCEEEDDPYEVMETTDPVSS